LKLESQEIEPENEKFWALTPHCIQKPLKLKLESQEIEPEDANF
jgi:hypothetical protein